MKKLFESAKYKKIIDSGEPGPYRVGALVFTGKDREARALADSESWGKQDRVLVNFFLLLGTVRSSHYQNMLVGLKELYRSTKIVKNDDLSFYLYQSIGLIRFYKGEFEKACDSAERALEKALLLKDNYLSMIANDLLAHGRCMQGQFARGLKLFDDSFQFSQKIQNNANSAIIELSKTIYKIEAGWDLPKESKVLEKWISTIETDDFYTLNDALILKAKYLMLKGVFKSAEELLVDVGRKVYSHKFSRQILSYNLTLAGLRLAMDGESKAMGLIGTSQALCSESEDFYFSQRFLELEQSLYKSLDRSSVEKLKALSARTGRVPNQKYPLSFFPDDVVDEMLPFKTLELNDLQMLHEKHLLGLLYLSGRYKDKNFADFSYGQRSVLLSVEGNLSLHTNLSTRQYELLSLLVEKRDWTRQELFVRFWGVPFDSFIHANKFYVTLKRLRNQLKLDQEIFFFEKGEIKVRSLRVWKTELDLDQEPVVADLVDGANPRHLKFLGKVRKGNTFTPCEYAHLFGVSRNTVSRDLRELTRLGVVSKHGEKRGTYYKVN